MENGDIAQNAQFHLFPQCFPCKSVSKNPIKATFQLPSADSVDLGLSQNAVLGNRLTQTILITILTKFSLYRMRSLTFAEKVGFYLIIQLFVDPLPHNSDF